MGSDSVRSIITHLIKELLSNMQIQMSSIPLFVNFATGTYRHFTRVVKPRFARNRTTRFWGKYSVAATTSVPSPVVLNSAPPSPLQSLFSRKTFQWCIRRRKWSGMDLSHTLLRIVLSSLPNRYALFLSSSKSSLFF